MTGGPRAGRGSGCWRRPCWSAACGGAGEPPAPPAPEVTVATAQEGTVPDRREYVGTVRAMRSVEVRARVRGYLLEQDYVDGQRVAEGDVLFRIDPSTYEVALAVAKAQLARARAAAAQAQADFSRASELFQGRVMSQAELDARRAERDATVAEVESARATVKAAELDLSYCTVRAPLAGRTSRRLVDPGNLVGESGQDTVLARIVQVDPIQVDFAVPERDRRDRRSMLRRRRGRRRRTPPPLPCPWSWATARPTRTPASSTTWTRWSMRPRGTVDRARAGSTTPTTC